MMKSPELRPQQQLWSPQETKRNEDWGVFLWSLGCNLTKLSPFDQMFRVLGLGLPDDVGLSMFVPICFTVEVVFPGWCHSSARLLLLRQAPGWAIYTESFADGFRWIVCMEGHDHQYWVILDVIDMFTSFLYLYNPLQHRCKMLQSNTVSAITSIVLWRHECFTAGGLEFPDSACTLALRCSKPVESRSRMERKFELLYNYV